MKMPGMHTGFRDDGSWRNWAGNQVAHPVRIERPRSEEEVVGLVRSAAAEGRKVRVVGAGHSFSAIAVTDEVLVTLDDFASVVSLDRDSGLARVEAGMRLFNLNPLLDAAGLAMPNLGDIAYQSVAGAIATSTHGTGLGFQSIAAGVVGLRMVTADGSVLVCDEQQNPEMLQVARVGLGALGIVTEVTLQCVPAFNLQAREEVMNIDDLLSNFDEFAENTDHTEFFWMPHTKNALLKRNTRTQEEPPPPRNRRHAARRKWKHFKNKELLENVAFGAMNHLGRLRPSLVPRFNAMMVPDEGSANYITTSYEVFASPRRVHFYEMEYAVARQDGLEAFRQVHEFSARSSGVGCRRYFFVYGVGPGHYLYCRARVSWHGVRTVFPWGGGHHEPVRRPPPLGQTPLPNRRNPGRPLPALGGVSGFTFSPRPRGPLHQPRNNQSPRPAPVGAPLAATALLPS